MREAQVNGHLITAGPTSPKVALCPACGEEVCKRRRKNGKRYTYFYRHRAGLGDNGCSLRYRLFE